MRSPSRAAGKLSWGLPGQLAPEGSEPSPASVCTHHTLRTLLSQDKSAVRCKQRTSVPTV